MTHSIQWICFDVGETLFDETGHWHRWSDWLGVPRATFMAALKEIVRQGRHHREVFERYRPGFDLAAAQAERLAAGDDPSFHAEDLFADVRPCCDRLVSAGFRIGVAGNTSQLTEQAIVRAELPVSFIASSERWGVAKPDPAFFAELARACQAPPHQIAYVGDRLDNDVRPAEAAGMRGIFLRRGLWSQTLAPNAGSPIHRDEIDSLAALPDVLRRASIEPS